MTNAQYDRQVNESSLPPLIAKLSRLLGSSNAGERANATEKLAHVLKSLEAQKIEAQPVDVVPEPPSWWKPRSPSMPSASSVPGDDDADAMAAWLADRIDDHRLRPGDRNFIDTMHGGAYPEPSEKQVIWLKNLVLRLRGAR